MTTRRTESPSSSLWRVLAPWLCPKLNLDPPSYSGVRARGRRRLRARAGGSPRTSASPTSRSSGTYAARGARPGRALRRRAQPGPGCAQTGPGRPRCRQQRWPGSGAARSAALPALLPSPGSGPSPWISPERRGLSRRPQSEAPPLSLAPGSSWRTSAIV